jgi:hypothetical protein
MAKELSGYPLPNADYPHSVRIVVPVAPLFVQLPDMEIQDDFLLLLKAWPGNPAGANYVFVAENPGAAINPDLAWPLVQNEPVTWRVKNANELWASATAAPSWLIVAVEMRRRNG